jgi:hypothetical protein
MRQGDYNGRLGPSRILPTRCARLWVKVDNRARFASCFSRSRKMKGEGGFPRTALLAQNGDSFHFAGIAAILIAFKT